MILEGILTTRRDDGRVNIAPMGPIVDQTVSTLHLRPFKTSQTYRSLCAFGQGVFHVTDDVLLLAQAAINRLDEDPPTMPAVIVDGAVLQSCCRWYEFQVEHIDDAEERTHIDCRVVHAGRLRDFFGFNRAKHAVLEAAILATRVHLLSPEDIRRRLRDLKAPVEKTGGPSETTAFALLEDYVALALETSSGRSAG